MNEGVSDFVWEIDGSLNEAGLIAYTNGKSSVVETDEEGKETTTLVSDAARGTLALLADNTLQWTEEVEIEVEHIFVRK